MSEREAEPRTWLFWVLPPVLCGLAMGAHCVLHVPTGEMEARPAKKDKAPKKGKASKKRDKPKKARTP